MDTVNQQSQFITRLQQGAAQVWYWLRSPKVTVGVIIVLGVVGLVALVVPQQRALTATAENWTPTLPVAIQPWGEPLYLLGFAHLVRSLWFWLPVGLLLLNSLIALVDYSIGFWPRTKGVTPSIAWQHPLAQRAEHIVRLPKDPDEFLDGLRTSLAEHGYFIYEPVEAGDRIIGAGRRRWAWTGPPVIYSGLVLLVGALLVSSYFLQTGWLTLFPLEPKSNSLFPGKFELSESGDQTGSQQVYYRSGKKDQPPQVLTWQLYRPTFFNNTLIWPLASRPILTVKVHDSAGTPLKLIPVQQDRPAAEQLNLALDQGGAPLYFSIPSARMAVQILPDTTSPELYNVQVRRTSEASPSENKMVSLGKTLKLDDLSLMLSLDRNLEVWTHRDPALPLYLLGLILVGMGLIFTFVCPPIQLWLLPEVKGLGGQLYGVVEKWGTVEGTVQFLKELLADDEGDKDDDGQLEAPAADN